MLHGSPGALRVLVTAVFFSFAFVGAASSCGGSAPKYSQSGGYGGGDYDAPATAAPAEEDYYEESEVTTSSADAATDYDDYGDDERRIKAVARGTSSSSRVAQADAPREPSPAQPTPGPGGDKKAPASPPPGGEDGTPPTSGAGTPATKGAVATSAQEKRPKPLLIYNANLHLAVFEASKAIDQIEKLAIERGGYLVRRTDNSITVRVPAESFHESLELVADVGDELHRDVSVSDVTAEFNDLHTQLRNLEAVRDRLETLLDKAKTVQEALQVERELTRVTGEIERIKGRLKLLGELIAFSTITVHFQAAPVEQLSSTVELPFKWLGRLGLPNLLDL